MGTEARRKIRQISVIEAPNFEKFQTPPIFPLWFEVSLDKDKTFELCQNFHEISRSSKDKL